MAFKKQIIVMSGGGKTGLVKLSGSFDGLGKVKAECACEIAAGGAKLYIIADEVTEIAVDGAKRQFEVPISAKGDISCLLVSGGSTMAGSTVGRADRRQLEKRVELFKREKQRAAAARKSTAVLSSPAGEERGAAEPEMCSPLPSDGRDTAPPPPPPVSEAALRDPLREPSEAPFSPLGARAETARAGVRFDGTNFYQAVKPQIDELFVRYPAEERLNALVPNSKWVRVDVDTDDYYVLGVLFDLSSPIFICYGVPGTRTVPPPREIAPAAVWLPLDNNRPDSDGFWMIYQSAADGKCVT